MGVVQLRQSGKQVVVVLPAKVARKLKLSAGQSVSVKECHGIIMIKPMAKGLTLEQMLAGVTPGMLSPPIEILPEGSEIR